MDSSVEYGQPAGPFKRFLHATAEQIGRERTDAGAGLIWATTWAMTSFAGGAMGTLARLAAIVAFGSSLVGCAHQQPLISHAHVGHGLTHWQDTPGNKGLFTV